MAVGDDQLDILQATGRSERRNFVQNGFDSLSPTLTPRISWCPVADIPVAMTAAWDTTGVCDSEPAGDETCGGMRPGA
ncbi:hypothetical protein QF027_009878 [Streptomyces canus]|nr:hypothetical protein [Streptomyces canus]